jgi:kynurenine formamidase
MDSLFDSISLIDLSHSIHKNIPAWEPNKILSIEEKETFSIYSKHLYTLDGGLSTHIDSPLHFFKNGVDVSRIETKKLFVKLVLIDISEKCTKKHDYQLSVEDVLEYEQKFRKIKKDDFVVIYTGWSRFWTEVDKYRGAIKKKIPIEKKRKEEESITEENEYMEILQFPTVSEEAISILIERDISGIGIDTLSPDIDETFPVHKAVLGAGKLIVENLNDNLRLLPKQGAHLIISPLKIEGGSEAPTRVFCLI